MENDGINVLSLFDGMSCGMIALERAGIKVKHYYSSEIDKYAIKVSENNYPNIIRLGDITKLRYEDGYLKNETDTFFVGEIDLLIGGSRVNLSLTWGNKKVYLVSRGYFTII